MNSSQNTLSQFLRPKLKFIFRRTIKLGNHKLEYTYVLNFEFITGGKQDNLPFNQPCKNLL